MATTSIAITKAAYVEAAAIGATGRITNPNEDDVYVFLNPTIPAATDVGHLLVGISEDNAEYFQLSGNATDKAWVRFADNALSASGSVIVSLGDAGAGAATLVSGVGAPVPSTIKSIQAVLTGTGAVSCTVSIQQSNTDANYDEVASMSLSGSDSVVELVSFQSAFKYTKSVVSALTGTGAACVVTVGY